MADVPIPDAPKRPASTGAGLLERLQPALTLVIALVAIGLALWEGAENRRHNRLSVLPRLGAEVDAGRTSETEYVRLAVESTGLGPAVFRTFRIYFDGVVQETATVGSNPWRNVIAAVSDSATQINAHAFGAGYYFPTGHRVVLFEALRPRTTDTAGRPPLADLLSRVAVQVCYCSIYDTDCDEVVLTTGDVTPLPCTD